MKRFYVLFVVLMSCLMSCTNPSMESAMLARTTGATGKPALCLVGDSRVANWPDGSFADNWDVNNAGVGSTDSYFTAFRIAGLTERYDTIVISVGINDPGTNLTLQQSVICINSCIVAAKQKADHVFVTTIPGVRVSYEFDAPTAYAVSYRAAQANSYIPGLALQNGVGLISLHNLMNTGFYLKAEYDDGSGIHYNLAGYEAIEELYESKIKYF